VVVAAAVDVHAKTEAVAVDVDAKTEAVAVDVDAKTVAKTVDVDAKTPAVLDLIGIGEGVDNTRLPVVVDDADRIIATCVCPTCVIHVVKYLRPTPMQ
jgi:hypothetical protein